MKITQADKKYFKEIVSAANEYNIFTTEELEDILSKLESGFYSLPWAEKERNEKNDRDNIEYILSTKIKMNGKFITYYEKNNSKKTIDFKNIFYLNELLFKNNTQYKLYGACTEIFLTKQLVLIATNTTIFYNSY